MAEASSIDVKLRRLDRVYRPGESVEGIIIVNAKKSWSHNGLELVADGSVLTSHTGTLRLDVTNQPVVIMKLEKNICPAGTFPAGLTEIPFHFSVVALRGQTLLETYHGVYISILYNIAVSCDRGLMKTSLRKDLEFIVEAPTSSSSIVDPKPIIFDISPRTLENIGENTRNSVPNFQICGKLHKSICSITQPLTGEVSIDVSISKIASIELQLVRVESVNLEGRATKEATEIQNIQIGDGDVMRNLTIPMYMIFPRLFSCPTIETDAFKVRFEVNLICLFEDGHMITENFPIAIYRDT